MLHDQVCRRQELGIVLHASTSPRQGLARALRLAGCWLKDPDSSVMIACLGTSATLALAAEPHAGTLRAEGLQLAESGRCMFWVCPTALRQRGHDENGVDAPFRAKSLADILLRWQASTHRLEFA